MANFKIVRELADIRRDKGLKRLLLALYEASDGEGEGPGRRYAALSEQARANIDTDEWVSTRKGITIRRGEMQDVIRALQSADFDAAPDTKSLSAQEYSKTLDWG